MLGKSSARTIVYINDCLCLPSSRICLPVCSCYATFAYVLNQGVSCKPEKAIFPLSVKVQSIWQILRLTQSLVAQRTEKCSRTRQALKLITSQTLLFSILSHHTNPLYSNQSTPSSAFSSTMDRAISSAVIHDDPFIITSMSRGKTREKFRIDHGDIHPHYGFSTHSPHPVTYLGREYPTSKHLLQALPVSVSGLLF